MKVLHILQSEGIYGKEKMLLDLVMHHSRSGINIKVVCLSSRDNGSTDLEQKLRSIGIEVLPIKVSTIPTSKEVNRFISEINQHAPEIIHCHDYKSNILTAFLLRGTNAKKITTFHGNTKHKIISKAYLYQLMDSLCSRFFHRVVYLHRDQDNRTFKPKLKNTKIVPNGVSASPSKIKWAPKKKDSITVGSLGRLSKEKNFQCLIEAIKELKDLGIPATAVIHGEGREKDNLKDVIELHKLNGIVEINGYRDDIDQFLCNIDVFVNCSTTEGMPISIIEAFRNGTPVIASNIPANRNVLSQLEKKYPFVIYGNTPSELAKAIIALKNCSSLAQLSFDVEDYYRHNFSVEKMAKGYETIYKEIQ